MMTSMTDNDLTLEETIGTLYQRTIELKERARKSVGNIDSYVEAAEFAHRAGELSAEGSRTAPDASLAHQHAVYSVYYFYEEHDCLSGYYYEKRNTELGKEHAQQARGFITGAINLLSQVPPDVTEDVRQELHEHLPSFNHYLRTIEIKILANDARKAWDEERYIDALDLYRRMVELQKQDLKALSDPIALQYWRIARGNYIGYSVNVSSALAQLMLKGGKMSDDRQAVTIPDDLAVTLLSHTVNAYQLAQAAFEENPEWEQYRDNAGRCLRNIQNVLRSNPNKWLPLYLAFEDEPEFVKIMKMTNLEKFKEVEAKRRIRENKIFKLWAVGSFWLLCLAVIVGLILLIQARVTGFWQLAILLTAVEVVLVIVGALILRTIGDLSERHFVELIRLAFRYQFNFLKLLRRNENDSE
jgi:hypothetical protein